MVSPIIAAIISFFLPGIGQFLQGEKEKGIVMFAIAILLFYMLGVYIGNLGYFVYFVYPIYVAYDAYKMPIEG